MLYVINNRRFLIIKLLKLLTIGYILALSPVIAFEKAIFINI